MKEKVEAFFNDNKKTTLFAIIPFILPSIITRTFIGQQLTHLWKLLVLVWLVWNIYKERKFDILPILFSAFYGIIILNGIVHKHFELKSCTAVIILWVIYYLTNEKEKRIVFYKVYLQIMQVLFFLNLVSMIVFFHGMYKTIYRQNWILGYKNTLILQIIPAIVIMYFSYKELNKELDKKFFSFFIVGLITLLVSRSSTSIICVVVFSIGFIIVEKRKFPKKIGVFISFIICSVISLLLVTGKIGKTVIYIVTTLMHRSIKFTGRTAIWKGGVEILKKTFGFGKGYIKTSDFHLKFHITHAHNMLLNYLILGGFICVIFLMVTLLYFDKCRSLCINPITDIMVVMMITFFVMGLVEALLLDGNLVYPTMIIAGNIMSNLTVKQKTNS